MEDDVPDGEKMERFRLLEDLQEGIATRINQKYLGTTVEVLFEERVRDRWKGRTPTNKLVFVEVRGGSERPNASGHHHLDRAMVHAG